jgi:hypothetical protein
LVYLAVDVEIWFDVAGVVQIIWAYSTEVTCVFKVVW